MKGKVFTTQEVQAMLSGSKVMFREVIKPQPEVESGFENNEWCLNWKKFEDGFSLEELAKRAPYQVGQKIFVKETFSYSDQPWCDKNIFYKASHGDRMLNTFSVSNRENNWRSPITMQEYDSRLTPLIKEMRVERLRDISEEDAIAEGIPLSEEFKDRYYTPESNYAVPKIAFMRWWNATHKKPEEKFEANPWVWVVSCEVEK